nr:KUP/HAK/KT family potassium transporter [Croceicoccus ponticola]
MALTLGAIGVVYGDIGTSPLYAFREALAPHDAKIKRPYEASFDPQTWPKRISQPQWQMRRRL